METLPEILELTPKKREIWILTTLYNLECKINKGFWISNKVAVVVIGAIAAMLGINITGF